MLVDHNEIKLEINNRRIPGKFKNICRFWDFSIICRSIWSFKGKFKIVWIKENETTTSQCTWYASKAVEWN